MDLFFLVWRFCFVALGMKRSRGHNLCNHNDANKLLKAIKYFSTVVVCLERTYIYIYIIFSLLNLQFFFLQTEKQRFYWENKRCYCCCVADSVVVTFVAVTHKNLFFQTSNTMSRTYFTQYWVLKLTFNEVKFLN